MDRQRLPLDGPADMLRLVDIFARTSCCLHLARRPAAHGFKYSLDMINVLAKPLKVHWANPHEEAFSSDARRQAIRAWIVERSQEYIERSQE